MNGHNDLENDLKELGQAIGSDQDLMENLWHQTRLSGRRFSGRAHRHKWRWIMKRPLMRISAAAVVLLATVIVIQLGNTSNVWAHVLEKVNQTDSYSFRIRQVETTGPRSDGFEFATEKETIVYRSAIWGAMDETTWNGELFTRYYRSLEQGECARICYPLESYERWTLTDDGIKRLRDRHPQQIIVKILQGPYESIGSDRIDGMEVEGIQTQDPNVLIDPTDYYDMDLEVEKFVARVWIDSETQWPVWLEFNFTPKGSSMHRTLVMDQFEWGVQLDSGLFAFKIPDDFKPYVADSTENPSNTKTEAQLAFEESQQNDPYLPSCDTLERPDVSELVLLGVESQIPVESTRLVTNFDIWEAQDAFIATWPVFDDVVDVLAEELEDTFAVSHMDVNSLVATAVALRERFWQEDACLSETSYPYAYAARLLMEQAHDLAPEDMDVTDQLVESIQAYEVLWSCPPDPNRFIHNSTYTETIMDLRLQQFDQIKRNLEQGVTPGWKELIRVCELASLLSYSVRFEEGLLVVTWLEDQQESAGWSSYIKRFNTLRRRLTEQRKSACPVFTESQDFPYPEAYRYSRRLTSFQGPDKRRKVLRPRF